MSSKPQPPVVAEMAAYLSARIGLKLSGPRSQHLLRQVGDAMSEAGVASSEGYRATLERDTGAFDELIARVTVGESYFFREPAQLDVLRSTIVPDRRRARGAGLPLQLWSAGCANGQEAYTLAIVLAETEPRSPARIVGTDLSREAIHAARAAIYGEWSLRAVTPAQRAAYFSPVASGYLVAERFLRAVSFRQLNLLDDADPVPADMDVVLCRNVLIYFASDAVAVAGRRLAASLAPGGWLVLGSADPPLHDVPGLVPTVTPAGVMYRKAPRPSRGSAAPTSAGLRPPVMTPIPPVAARPASGTDRVRRPTPATPEAEVRETSAATAEEAVREVRALGGSGALAEAVESAAEAVARFPLHTELRYLHAVVLLELGRPGDAARAARAALYLDPGLVMGHVALARAELSLGRVTAARRCLRNVSGLLAALPPDTVVPLSEGQSAGRLAAMVSAHDRTLTGGAGARGGPTEGTR